MNEHDEDLIQRVLDGAATADEVTHLQGRLAENPDLRQSYADLERVFRSLETIGPVEPPPGAKEEVLRHLQHGPARQWRPKTVDGEGWLYKATWALRKHLTPATAYAFAAGGIAGVAILSAFYGRNSGGLDGSAPGSMVFSSHVTAGKSLDALPFQAPGFTATLRSSVLDEGILVEVESRSAAAAKLGISFDPAALALSRFEQADATGVALDQGHVAITLSEEGHYRLYFEALRAPTRPLQVRIEVGGTVLEGGLRTSTTEL